MTGVKVWSAKAAFVVSIVGLLSMSLPGIGSKTSAQQDQYEPSSRFKGPVVQGRVLVKFRSGTSENEAAELIAERGGHQQKSFLARVSALSKYQREPTKTPLLNP